MRLFYHLIAISLIVQGCAQTAPPSGGPKDTEPPKVVEAEPTNGTVGFSGNSFSLEFDEYVQTRNLNQQLVVSPPLNEDPEVYLKGKTLNVEWEDSLKANTTYSFRFGKGVQDITENNPAKGLIYVLSTGDYLDSLKYSGRILDAKTLEPESGVWAMLYKMNGDSVPMNERPFYFARTDKNGKFTIPYVKEGAYKFFGLNDKNYNYRYDLPNEEIAFLERSVRPVPADSAQQVDIRLFQEAPEEQLVLNSNSKPGKLEVFLKKPADTIELRNRDGSGFPFQVLSEHRKNQDTAVFWFPDMGMEDSLKVLLKDESDVLDTSIVRSAGMREDSAEKLSLRGLFGSHLDLNEDLFFEVDQPVRLVDNDRIFAVHDSDTVSVGCVVKGASKRRIKVELDPKEGATYEIFFPSGSIKSVFGNVNDSLRFSVNVRERSHYGHLKVELEVGGPEPRGPYIFKLLKEGGGSERELYLKEPGTIDLPYLDPGKYRGKLILDRNRDRIWTTGDYLKGEQPEEVIYYSGTLKARSNWEQTIEWTVEGFSKE